MTININNNYFWNLDGLWLSSTANALSESIITLKRDETLDDLERDEIESVSSEDSLIREVEEQQVINHISDFNFFFLVVIILFLFRNSSKFLKTSKHINLEYTQKVISIPGKNSKPWFFSGVVRLLYFMTQSIFSVENSITI